MGVFDFLKKKDSKHNFNSATVVDRLEELGYFKYAAVEDITENKKRGRNISERKFFIINLF